MTGENRQTIRNLMDDLQDINFQLEDIMYQSEDERDTYLQLSDATDYIDHAINRLDDIFA